MNLLTSVDHVTSYHILVGIGETHAKCAGAIEFYNLSIEELVFPKSEYSLCQGEH
jgi:hypothetical protein